MAKRIADSQITRETFKEEGSNSDDENGSSSNHGMAPASVMSRRKIAMPKRKSAGAFAFQNQANGGANMFSKPTSDSQTSRTFNFLQNSQSSTDSTSDNDEHAKMKALNLQFKEKVVDTLTKDPFADLRPALDKYREYIGSIKLVKKPELAATQQLAGTDNANEEKSSSEEENDIAVEGPKFTLESKPPTSDSVFTFGAKKSEKRPTKESDSEDEIEIKGPQFTFSGQVKSEVFKLDKPVEEKKENSENSSITNPFSPQNSESTSNKTAKPAFKFGQTSANDTKPTFNFGQTKFQTEEPKKPSFNFGLKASTADTAEKSESKPSFSFKFGEPKSQQDSSDNKPKPIFSFGAPKTESSNGKKPEAKPTFSFGAPKAESNNGKNLEAKPAFSFGSSNASTAPSFSFSKPNESTNSNATVPTTTEKENSGAASGATSGSFKFSLPFSQKPSSQAPASPPVATTPTVEEATPEGDGEEPNKSMGMQNGEENEDPLFSQRSKLMTFNNETKAYDSKGVGELKLLQKKDDKSKVRLLCRSDGMGNILLNTSLVKSFTYAPLTPESGNLIKIPAVGTEGKLITYVAKFKQKSDGQLLVKSIENVQKDM